MAYLCLILCLPEHHWARLFALSPIVSTLRWWNAARDILYPANISYILKFKTRKNNPSLTLRKHYEMRPFFCNINRVPGLEKIENRIGFRYIFDVGEARKKVSTFLIKRKQTCSCSLYSFKPATLYNAPAPTYWTFLPAVLSAVVAWYGRFHHDKGKWASRVRRLPRRVIQ